MKDKFGAQIYSKDLRLCIYSEIRKPTLSNFQSCYSFYVRVPAKYNSSQLSKERNKWVCSKKVNFFLAFFGPFLLLFSPNLTSWGIGDLKLA